MQGHNKYSIQKVFGEGSLRATYHALDRLHGSKVSIKAIIDDRTTMDAAPSLLARFNNELQAASHLTHPGIVSLHDYGESQGRVYVVTELTEGHCLQDCLESVHALALSDIVHFVLDILHALEHAHRNGVVHSNINPSNIVITDDHRVKVDDFGLARIESYMWIQGGFSVGTPAYMSPEQLQMLAVDGRSDLFSAGVILYQLLTGQLPFSGGSVIDEILMRNPPPPSSIRSSVPTELDMVVAKALSKRAENRFASAADFAEALREAVPRDAPTEVLHGEVESSDASSSDNWDVELEYWSELMNSSEVREFEAFLLAFPKSPLVPLVRRRVEKMRKLRDSSVACEGNRDAPAEEVSQDRIELEAKDVEQRGTVDVNPYASADVYISELEAAPEQKGITSGMEPVVVSTVVTTEQPCDISGFCANAAEPETEAEVSKSRLRLGPLLRFLLAFATLLAIGFVVWTKWE